MGGMSALDVLLLSNGPAALTDVTAELEAAGHRVVRCHPATATAAWPCAALVGEPCPLEGGVDVALDVRMAVSSGTSPWEDGVACAAREDVPIVLAGRTAMHPFGSHPTLVVEGRERLADAVERAAELARTEREASVQAVCGAPVTLHRDGSHLHVDVFATPATPAERGMLATRAAGAARSITPRATHVTVAVKEPVGA